MAVNKKEALEKQKCIRHKKQILCINSEIVPSVVVEFTKILKTLILTQKSIQSALVVLCLYDICNEKKHIFI